MKKPRILKLSYVIIIANVLMFSITLNATPMYCSTESNEGKKYHVSNVFDANHKNKVEIENSFRSFVSTTSGNSSVNAARCVRFDSTSEASWSRTGWTSDLKGRGYEVIFLDWSY